jgi:hypothetical protein
LTTEYPANGSFRKRKHYKQAVCPNEGWRLQAPGFRLRLPGKISGVRAVEALLETGVWNLRSAGVSSIVVKLLRAYGECLGARSR